ncbi:hypothetical protein O3M35_007508 [Rhynocoris fuscipes]|uniref:Uncharacterized protein n=1 Tax=Rhynocoris fuscipes TaxID=488301 RepID=A0AAW1DCA4_9HEMI
MATRITFSALNAVKNQQLLKCKQTSSLICRSLAAPTGQSTVAENIRKKQAVFGMDDSTPIYLKGGNVDRILFRFTMGCCILALSLIAKNFYQLTQGKK